jgi:hypothetical protein
MGNNLVQFIPKQGLEILLVLFLSFLIGLEREEQKGSRRNADLAEFAPFPCLASSAMRSACFRKETSCCRLSLPAQCELPCA